MNDEHEVNISLFKKQRSNCLDFPEDVIFDPNLPFDQREGKIEVFTKNRNCRLAILNYKNNQLNGVCKFYEKGELNIPHHALSVLADFYHTSVDYLLGRTDEIKPYPKRKNT